MCQGNGVSCFVLCNQVGDYQMTSFALELVCTACIAGKPFRIRTILHDTCLRRCGKETLLCWSVGFCKAARNFAELLALSMALTHVKLFCKRFRKSSMGDAMISKETSG